MCHQRTDCGSPVLDNQHIYDIDFPLTNLLKPFPKNFFQTSCFTLGSITHVHFKNVVIIRAPIFVLDPFFIFGFLKRSLLWWHHYRKIGSPWHKKKKLSLGLNFSMKIAIRACNVFISYSEKRLAQKFCVWRGRQETFIAVGRSSF